MAVTQIKAANLTVEGIGYLGRVDEVTLPVLEMNVGEHRGIGMDAPMPIDLGMNMLTLGFTTSGPDFGLTKLFGKHIQARIEAVLEGASTGVPAFVQVIAGGRMTMADMQAWAFSGELSPSAYTMSLDYYSLIDNGIKIVEIDVPGGIRFLDGFDALAEARALLGI